jgi:hypothetical protein
MVCRFCNKKTNGNICRICRRNKMINKSVAQKKYGLTGEQLGTLESIKLGTRTIYIEDDVKNLFDELSEKIIMGNDNNKKILEKKKIMTMEDERIRSIEYKKHTIKKILAIYLEKSEKKYVNLYNYKISALISSYSTSSLSATDIAAGICLEIEKCIADNKTSNDIVLSKTKTKHHSHKFYKESAIEDIQYNPTEDRINNINDAIYKNFDTKDNGVLKKSLVYKQYVDGKIYNINDALVKMREIINNAENRDNKLFDELKKYGILKTSDMPYGTEKYFLNYLNNNGVSLKETVNNIVKTRDFWRIVFFNHSTSKTETKYLSKLKTMFINNKISDDGLVREFVSLKIRLSESGWDTFVNFHKIKHYDLDIHLRKKIDKTLFDFFDSEEIDLEINNMSYDTQDYVFKRCQQLTFKCATMEGKKNTVTYDISKPINLMGEKM